MVANETNQKDSKERILTIKTLAVKKHTYPIMQSIALFIYAYKKDMTSEQISDIRTALAEAVNNSCMHAYPDNNPGEVSISLYICNKKDLEIEIQDFGCGIENVKKATEPLFSSKKDYSGMGFAFMEAFSNEIDIKSTPGKGTIVTLRWFQLF